MNLKQLEYFMHVAELGSFSQAARVLGIAQPALSRQVRLLETDLRETLLLRNGRGATLTEAGKRLFEHSVGILQLVARAREDIGARRDDPVGGVVIGVPPSIARQITLPLIEMFRTQLPRARLSIVEGLSAYIAEWIGTGRVDIGLLYNPEPVAGLETVPLRVESLMLVQRAATPARREARAPIPLKQLPQHPLILPERAHTFRRLLETQATHAGVRLDVAWEVSSVPTILDLVAAGHGNAVLTASAVEWSPFATRLVVRPIVEPTLTSVLCLASSARKRATPLAVRVMSMLRDLAERTTTDDDTATTTVAPAPLPARRRGGRG